MRKYWSTNVLINLLLRLRSLHHPPTTPDHHPRQCRHAGDEQKKFWLGHPAPEAADIAREKAAGETGGEPDAHHQRDEPRRRDFGHERQADWREIKLAERDDDEISEQPEPARFAGCSSCPAMPASAGMERCRDHDQIGRGDAETAERHFGDGRRLGAARRLPRP